jgi:predicted alpha/beta superfamily hydrolase
MSLKTKAFISIRRFTSAALTVGCLQAGVLWASAGSACAQTASATTALRLGDTFSLESKVLGETRRINIYVPAIYHDSASLRLPVLYMPDGGVAEDFLHVAGLVQGSVANETMRPFLLVGIENTARRRDLTGPTTSARDRQIAPQVGGSAVFRQFLRRELMPEIQRRYRTTAETALVGESLAGLFVIETLLLEPDLFTTYLAFDPSLWWDNEALLAQAPRMLRAYAGPPKTLFLASSGEPQLAAEAARLAALLRTAAPKQFTYFYEPFPQETHGTIYQPAALSGFRQVFKPLLASPKK